MQGRGQGHILDPFESGIDDDALGHAPGVVPVVNYEVALRVTEGVGKGLRTPVDLAGNGLCGGGSQAPAVVKPQTPSAFVATVKPIAVELPGTDIWQEDMPGLIGLLGHGNAQLTSVRFGRADQAKC